MDDKPKVNELGYLGFGFAVVLDIPFFLAYLGLNVIPENLDWSLHILLVPWLTLFAIVLSIRGIYESIKYEIGGLLFSVLGLIGGCVPVVHFLSYLAEIGSIGG